VLETSPLVILAGHPCTDYHERHNRRNSTFPSAQDRRTPRMLLLFSLLGWSSVGKCCQHVASPRYWCLLNVMLEENGEERYHSVGVAAVATGVRVPAASANAGTYSSSPGNDALEDCVSCLKGKYSIALGAHSSATCSSCDSGKYSTLAGDTVCDQCGAGKYSNTLGAAYPYIPSLTAAGDA
jgi:hypothetical protein